MHLVKTTSSTSFTQPATFGKRHHSPCYSIYFAALRGDYIQMSLFFGTPTLAFDHNSCQSCLNEQCKGILSIYISRPPYWCPRGLIWCLFTFLTKALNIRNSSTNVIPKMGIHLGVIKFHPLHSPPFMKVCFTSKHTFGFIGPCTSHLFTNSMLKL